MAPLGVIVKTHLGSLNKANDEPHFWKLVFKYQSRVVFIVISNILRIQENTDRCCRMSALQRCRWEYHCYISNNTYGNVGHGHHSQWHQPISISHKVSNCKTSQSRETSLNWHIGMKFNRGFDSPAIVKLWIYTLRDLTITRLIGY